MRQRNPAAIVPTDVMMSKTRRVTKSGIADAQKQIAGFLIVEAADMAAAGGLFQAHPAHHRLPGDGIDVMPVVAPIATARAIAGIHRSIDKPDIRVGGPKTASRIEY